MERKVINPVISELITVLWLGLDCFLFLIRSHFIKAFSNPTKQSMFWLLAGAAEADAGVGFERWWGLAPPAPMGGLLASGLPEKAGQKEKDLQRKTQRWGCHLYRVYPVFSQAEHRRVPIPSSSVLLPPMLSGTDWLQQ